MMKLVPDFFNDSLLDQFSEPFFSRSSAHMKTDITEKDGAYLLDMELPGYQKEDIQMELKDGYLNINATTSSSKEEKDAAGKLLHQERFTGSCSRSFYLGEEVRQEDIKASFENGELKVSIAKTDHKVLEQKKVIPIE